MRPSASYSHSFITSASVHVAHGQQLFQVAPEDSVTLISLLVVKLTTLKKNCKCGNQLTAYRIPGILLNFPN